MLQEVATPELQNVVPTSGESAVSRDPQLGMLLGQLDEGADAAIAASAFCTLVTTVPNPSDSNSWELPVSVQLSAAADPLSSKVVCVDKPLLPRASTLRRKHEVLYKATLVSLSTTGRGAARRPTDRGSDGQPFSVRAGADPASAAEQVSGGTLHEAEAPATHVVSAETRAEPSAQHDDIRQSNGRPPQQEARRGVRYDLWRVGGFRAILRSHEVAQISGSMRRSGHSKPGDQHDAPVIARAKVEYIPNEQVRSIAGSGS